MPRGAALSFGGFEPIVWTMDELMIAAIETGGTKILARLATVDGKVVANGRWETGSAAEALSRLLPFLSDIPDGARLRAVGIAAFGPLVVDPNSPDYGRMLATPKPGWAGSNLRAELQRALGVPVAVDTDVNCAAIAEQRIGAGKGQRSLAYVTVGTGIGCGLAIDGRSLKGALHPEAGHLPVVRREDDAFPSACAFHSDCAEGLASGSAVRRRLGEGREFADSPDTRELVADYLGQLGAALVLAWSPHRIVWGGGVVTGGRLVPAIERRLVAALGGYGVGPAVLEPGFCTPAMLENAGLEGALLLARELAA